MMCVMYFLSHFRHLHVDGAKLEGTGFRYEVPEVTLGLLREVYLALAQ